MPSSTCPIENIVVVMLENRSYDNVLGWLYNSRNPPPFNQAPKGQEGLDGLSGKETNPGPNNTTVKVGAAAPATINGISFTATTVPAIDPGEYFGDMAQQFTGGTTVPTTNPYADGFPSGNGMSGFVNNYHLILTNTNPLDPIIFGHGKTNPNTGGDVSHIMTNMTPQNVPITIALAMNYAVVDKWHASVPIQIFCNRAFSLCAAPAFTSSTSIIDDASYALPLLNGDIEDMASIFSVIDQAAGAGAAPQWKVYFHDYSISAFTVPYVLKAATASGNINVVPFDNADWGANPAAGSVNVTPQTSIYQANRLGGSGWNTFAEDVQQGTLPKFSLIEPRYSNDTSTNSEPSGLQPNTNHSGASNYLGTGTKLSDSNPPVDVTYGELLLFDVYALLAASDYWEKNPSIITYDEPGGLYEHVNPTAIAKPETAAVAGSPVTIPAVGVTLDAAAHGFDFNVTGGRVPTIIVSPYVAHGSTITAPAGGRVFDHTSIIKTVWDVFGLADNRGPASLTERDLNAPSLYDFLDFSEARAPVELPQVKSPAQPG